MVLAYYLYFGVLKLLTVTKFIFLHSQPLVFQRVNSASNASKLWEKIATFFHILRKGQIYSTPSQERAKDCNFL